MERWVRRHVRTEVVYLGHFGGEGSVTKTNTIVILLSKLTTIKYFLT